MQFQRNRLRDFYPQSTNNPMHQIPLCCGTQRNKLTTLAVTTYLRGALYRYDRTVVIIGTFLAMAVVVNVCVLASRTVRRFSPTVRARARRSPPDGYNPSEHTSFLGERTPSHSTTSPVLQFWYQSCYSTMKVRHLMIALRSRHLEKRLCQPIALV